jgi:acyl-CoA synthetase (AMP-forming)/AMP-acid ligase II
MMIESGEMSASLAEYRPPGAELSLSDLRHFRAVHQPRRIAYRIMMAHASGLTAESVGINWLPLFHDMGLMGGVVQPLFAGFPITLLPPTAFLARPILWLQAITKYRATDEDETMLIKVDCRVRR